MQALGANSVFVFTGVPGRKGPVEIDTDLLMRNLVLRNQIVLGTVNAGRDAFEAAVRDLGEFDRRWPAALRSLISGRHAPEEYRELLLGRPTGIKHVISFAGN
jgi:glucose 1-dehydrogenase